MRIVESGLVQTNLRIDTCATNLLLYFNTVRYLPRLSERVLLGNRDNSKIMNHSHRSFQDQILNYRSIIEIFKMLITLLLYEIMQA